MARIERTLSIKLKRKEVSADIPQTPRKEAAPVIVMPPAPRPNSRPYASNDSRPYASPHSGNDQQRPKSFRFSSSKSFKPRRRRRPVRPGSLSQVL